MSVIVVGCGYWGRNLVRNFHALGALAGVCEPSAVGREVARKIAPSVPLFERFDDALASNATALVLATPAETHFGLAKRSLEAGKDLLVEKPLALDWVQGAELVGIARHHGRILMVGHVLEYHPAIIRLRELVHQGELGQLYYLYSNRMSLGKVRREESILWSFAPHDIAIILRIVGALPITVSASGAAYLQPQIADVTVTNLAFESGVRAHFLVSWLHPFKEQRLVAIGSRKMISYDDVSKRLELYDRRVDVLDGEPIPIAGASELLLFDQMEPLAAECMAFLEALRTRRAPLTDGASALAVLRVLEAAQTSLEQGGQPMAVKAPIVS